MEHSIRMNRRRLILSAAGAGLAVSGLSTTNALAALTATDDELAYANFGQATEFLLKDFYTKATAAKIAHGTGARSLARGAFNASEHASALGKLLTDAGQTAAVEDDFGDGVVFVALAPISDPKLVAAYLDLADAKTFSGSDDPHLKAMEARIAESADLPQDTQMRLHFALGKAYDDAGRFADAFEHFPRHPHQGGRS